ncbi:DUF4105 domain-containing protein [Pseudoxanthomonas dokdonensis]|uniref:Uncharacterized protein n=1 Tax=Pseudoxanthomonas dokdonensis TaxID=344882 RepID=A0A0R0CYV4_9GAMM|nr:DUF4105 domain-containing protein [Pseudoxanthomonas dokdonensis]KRG70964.1 hypothetical protein ABB29_03790 [Pseudoxanthomonas dokdonensis]
MIPRRRLRWALLAWLLLASPAWARVSLQLQSEGLSAAEIGASTAMFEQALQRLPPSWRDGSEQVIPVQWRDDLPAKVHGRAKSRAIWLNRQLLLDWMAAGATKPDTGSEVLAARQAVLAALIHELAHFHDRSAQGQLSRNPRLLDLAGWQLDLARPRRRVAGNAFSDRSPDRYELTSASEYVAVNLEYFLLDPQYACRRPALYRLFAEHFAWSPPASACAPDQVFVQSLVDDAVRALPHLEPDRVYAVDYLLAEGNQQAMSRWGHAMLRLVICKPGRRPGPDCRLDLQYHQVLSFRAFVDDVQVSSWRGLTGSYPSRMFVLPLSQVIDEYNKVELRGLQSIPLRLSPAEITQLLERAAQLHWSYDGRYYFISNNCAVEVFKLLHDGVPRLAGEGLDSITPRGLLRKLQRRGVADASVLQPRDQAERMGYYFPSADQHYQQLLDVVRAGQPIAQARVRDWLRAPATERARAIEHADLKASAALLVLENAALRQQEVLARDELKHRLLRPPAMGELSGQSEQTMLADYLRASERLSRPALLIEGGYGLPQAAERERLQRAATDQMQALQAARSRLHDSAKEWLDSELARQMHGTRDNLQRLGAQVRAFASP